jgi:integral membrane protein
MKNPVTLLRRTALLEAVSYLILLGVAMPLKYIWNIPEAVKVMGWIHGALFVVLCVALLQVLISAKWPVVRAALVFLASLVPLVPFFMDRWMATHERAYANTHS